MFQFRAIFLLISAFHLTIAVKNSRIDSELSKFLSEVNGNLSLLYTKELIANWQSEINGPSDLVALLQSEIAATEIGKYLKSIRLRVLKFKRLKKEDDYLKRQLMQIPGIAYEVLDQRDLKKIYEIRANMSDIYRTVKLCAFEDRNQCNLTLIPDVQQRLNRSKNVEEIDYYWLEWRQKTGFSARNHFKNFIKLYRKTAKLHGYSKPSDFWFGNLGESSKEIMDRLNKFLSSLRPLFIQFHAYVRQSLRNSYGFQKVPLNKPYPQNLVEIYIGEAFRDSESRQRKQLPYPHVSVPNIRQRLIERGVSDAQRIYWNVAEFYRSLGMESLPQDFWLNNASPNHNIDDVSTTCWHKAWNFYGLRQQKLSFCPAVDEERFFNMFEAVSDIYYFRAYKYKPVLFQKEPFPNFRDALGKVFRLSASSPKYLEKLKLFDRGVLTSREARVNRLYLQGLRTVFILPVFYILDRYRIDILDDKINVTDNCTFWKLTQQFTGALPPFRRSNDDFDAAAKLLIAVDDQYTSQIMSIVLQYQILKRFCELSGQYEKGNPDLPLDLCDLSDQRKIGPLVSKAISMGSSKSFKEVLKLLVGESELKIDGLLEYFKPLKDWLSFENRRRHSDIGWNEAEACASECGLIKQCIGQGSFLKVILLKKARL